MKRYFPLSFLFLAVLLLLTLTGCSNITLQEDDLVIGQTYRLDSGETVNNNLTIIGTDAAFDEDSTVNGDLTIIGGNVSIDGKVDGNISVMGGYVHLDDHATVTGDLVTLGGTVRRSSQARVEGNQTSERSSLPLPWMQALPVIVNFDPIAGPLTAIFQAFALAALAIVVQLFAGNHLDRAGRSAVGQPVVSGGVGLLTMIVAPAMILILFVTIILIPLSLLGVLALALAVLFGWVALGLMLGRQMSVWLKQSWTDPINAAVGTLVLSLLASMLNLIPCLGWLANFLIWLVALGTALLTRFGTQMYPTMPVYHQPATPYTPPSAPVTIEEPTPQAPPVSGAPPEDTGAGEENI